MKIHINIDRAHVNSLALCGEKDAFAYEQDLLGDARSFKTMYARRIEFGNDKNATAREREVRSCSMRSFCRQEIGRRVRVPKAQ